MTQPTSGMEVTAERPIVIAGSGRSGTTWVLDALAEANALRTVFEPLHPVLRTPASGYAYRYLPCAAPAPELEAFFQRVFEGNFHSLWSDLRVRPDRLWPGLAAFGSVARARALVPPWRRLVKHAWRYRGAVRRQRLMVKLIRGNLLLGWMRERFDARIALVVRHPGAVATSRMRLHARGADPEDWNPRVLLDRYLQGRLPGERTNERCADLLAQDLSPVQAHTLTWCVENQHPIEESMTGRYALVFHEHLVGYDAVAWPRLTAALGLSEVPDRTLLRVPSQQSSPCSPVARGSALGCWLDGTPHGTLSEINDVLEAFGVDAYDAFEPMPRAVQPTVSARRTA